MYICIHIHIYIYILIHCIHIYGRAPDQSVIDVMLGECVFPCDPCVISFGGAFACCFTDWYCIILYIMFVHLECDTSHIVCVVYSVL